MHDVITIVDDDVITIVDDDVIMHSCSGTLQSECGGAGCLDFVSLPYSGGMLPFKNPSSQPFLTMSHGY